ncbi:recombinase RecT [Ponticaulis profundi]|uniref:Recombinase RecT n=1 Tax=Ponticaulis profundi TaxID=2665222 RepID=A0ABW1S8U9_9PROT
MNDVTVKTPPKAPTTWRDTLDQVAPSFEDALPKHVSIDRFKRIVANAIAGDGYVQKALQENPKTVWSACMACAKDGLIPDGRDAAIVAYRSQKNGYEAQYIPMIGGLLKLIRQSGEVASISAHVVHKNDSFTYVLGDEERIEHSPALMNRGEMIAAYAIIRTKDGGIYRDIMGADEIAKVRSISKAKNGPWNGPFVGEMWKKTVLRRLAKRAPLSTDIMDVISRDDHLHDLDKAERLPEPRSSKLSLAALNEDVIDIEDDAPEAAESTPSEDAQPPLPKIPQIDFSDAADKDVKLWKAAMMIHLERAPEKAAALLWVNSMSILDECENAYPDVYDDLLAVKNERQLSDANTESEVA